MKYVFRLWPSARCLWADRLGDLGMMRSMVVEVDPEAATSPLGLQPASSGHCGDSLNLIFLDSSLSHGIDIPNVHALVLRGGSGKTMALAWAIQQFKQRLGERLRETLVLETGGSFVVDGGGQSRVLIGLTGEVYSESLHHKLARPSGAGTSPFRPLSKLEQRLEVPERVSARLPYETLAGQQLYRQALEWLSRKVLRLMVAPVLRHEVLIRLFVGRLVVLLRRQLGVQRHFNELQLTAPNCRHAVDQYRIRGPSFSRKTLMLFVFRECMAA